MLINRKRAATCILFSMTLALSSCGSPSPASATETALPPEASSTPSALPDTPTSTPTPTFTPTVTPTRRPTEMPNPIGPLGNSYAVIVKEDSAFRGEAEVFAENKSATLLTYHQSFGEVLAELGRIQPVYTAVFAAPEELTPDFVDDVDLSLRNIDPDPYLDTAFGIITSRDAAELEKYVRRLLDYVPAPQLKIYGISPDYKYTQLAGDFGIQVNDHCLTHCGGAFCVCDDEHRATLERIQSGLKDANVFVIGAHGAPYELALDNGERIEGSVDGLRGWTADGQELSLTHDVILSIAEACLTGRINGAPSTVDPRFDVDWSGQIDTSLVLSFLQSGSLNYIASTHVANTAIVPGETLIEESLLQGLPIGIALKDLKNRYLMITEKYKVAMEGSPEVTDPLTRDFVLFQVRNWILFGDPSTVVSEETYRPKNCIKGYTQQQDGNQMEVELKIRFAGEGRILANSQFISKVELNGQSTSTNGADVCDIKIPYAGEFQGIRVTIVSGVQDRFLGGPFPANAFYQDLGDEILIQVPYYVGESGSTSILLQFTITTSPDAA